MSPADEAKLGRIREHLRHEWTSKETVAGWRKWQAEIAAFTRPATEALMEAARLQPGMRVLDLASGVGDPVLWVAEAVGPAGRVTATDLGPDMMSLAAELARAKGIGNIEFRIANAESLPFPDASFDAVTCRFGIMFFPDLGKALGECLRVLERGGRAVFVAFGTKLQPFFTTTAGILLKYVDPPPPPPDPDAPNLFMFGERGRMRRALEAAGFSEVREDVRTVPGHWLGTREEYWQQFTEIAAPFRPLLERLTPEARERASGEVVEGLKEYESEGGLTIPVEIVIGSGRKR